MHLIHDENGNPVPHGHGEHEDGHCHGHEDGHCHGHEDGHCHGHEDRAAAPPDTAVLLEYMLNHNKSHAAELDKMAAKLAGEGNTAAAEQVRKAVDEYARGNLYLSLAVSLAKGE